MDQSARTGVVLLQLGGPDALDSIEPFLYNLFCDPDIIDLPFAFLFRKRLARLISRRRAPVVRELYRRIGSRSPIERLTRRQAVALERALPPSIGARVYIAMRYWRPFTSETVEAVYADGMNRVVLLPLYPHYSRTTTASSVKEWNRTVSEQNRSAIPIYTVREYYDHPSYLRALVENINIAIRRIPPPDRHRVHLLFSAHGTPVKLVRAGDPYSHQIRKTVEAVMKEGKWEYPHHLCFQSKVGPERWLEPSLDQTIDRLAGEGATHIVTIPIAFVSDHIETLSEINIEAKHRARNRGVRHFDMMPALNTQPHFIRCLADLVQNALRSA